MILPGDLEVRPPIPGESLDGYVAEITAANDLMKVRRISGSGGVAHGHRPQLTTTGWTSLPGLAELLGVDVAELQLRSHPFVGPDQTRRAFFGTTVHRIDLRHRERFFSPAALATASHHRAMWQLRLPFDCETGELLVSTCPRPTCGKVQRWRHSAGVRYCDSCVQDLSGQDVPRLEEDLLPAYRLATGLTHTEPGTRRECLSQLPEPVQALGADMAFELLLRLVPVLEPGCVWRSTSRLWANDPFQIASGMRKAWQVLQGWPDAILDTIAQQLAIATVHASDGNNGRTTDFLRLRAGAHVPLAVADAIRTLHEGIDEDGPNGERVRLQTMDCKEASRVIGIGTGKLVPLRRQGALKSTTIARGPLIIAGFDRAEIEKVASDIQERCDLTAAGVALGLPYYGVEQLCALGHVTRLAHPYFEARYHELQVTQGSLEAFVERISRKKANGLGSTVPITSALRMVGGRLKPWDAIVTAMLSGDLPFEIAGRTQPLFGRIRVRKADLQIPAAELITRPGAETPLTHRMDPAFAFADRLTKRDAGEVLNLTPKQFTPLLSSYPSNPGRTVPIEDVLRIADQFISTTEIAERLDTTYKAVLGKVGELGILRRSEAGFERRLAERVMFS